MADATKTTARHIGHMTYTQAPAVYEKNIFHLFRFTQPVKNYSSCEFQKHKVMTMSVAGGQPKKTANTSYKATKHTTHFSNVWSFLVLLYVIYNNVWPTKIKGLDLSLDFPGGNSFLDTNWIAIVALNSSLQLWLCSYNP